MITKSIWENVCYKLFAEPIDYFLAIIASVLTIPLDILLSPFEIIGFIMYKIFEEDER